MTNMIVVYIGVEEHGKVLYLHVVGCTEADCRVVVYYPPVAVKKLLLSCLDSSTVTGQYYVGLKHETNFYSRFSINSRQRCRSRRLDDASLTHDEATARAQVAISQTFTVQ